MSERGQLLTEADFNGWREEFSGLPIVPDEGGSWLMGYGHLDKAQVVAALKANPNYEDSADPDAIVHMYGFVESWNEYGEWDMTWTEISKDSQGAFPTTVVQL